MNLIFGSTFNELFFVPLIITTLLMITGLVVLATAPNNKVAAAGTIAATSGLVFHLIFFISASLSGNNHGEKLTQVRSEVEQVYGVDISTTNAEKIIKAIESELFFIEGSVIQDDINLLVDETPVSVDLIYVDEEYRFYVDPSALDNPSVELPRG